MLNDMAEAGYSYSAVKKARRANRPSEPGCQGRVSGAKLRKPTNSSYTLAEMRQLLSGARSVSLREHLIVRIFYVLDSGPANCFTTSGCVVSLTLCGTWRAAWARIPDRVSESHRQVRRRCRAPVLTRNPYSRRCSIVAHLEGTRRSSVPDCLCRIWSSRFSDAALIAMSARKGVRDEKSATCHQRLPRDPSWWRCTGCDVRIAECG